MSANVPSLMPGATWGPLHDMAHVGSLPRRESLAFPETRLTALTREVRLTAVPKSLKQTILVVDDEETLRSLTTRILEDHGYSVIQAHDGFEAWTLLESMAERIDLVVSDVVMPRLDGIELARCMEILPHPPPVLLVSGYGLGALELERPILAKPFRGEELLAAVHRLLAAPGQDDMGSDAS